MKSKSLIFLSLFFTTTTWAATSLQECAGRITFNTPEAMDWVLPNGETFGRREVSADFQWEVTSRDHISYAYDDGLNIRVSQPTTLEYFNFSIMGISGGNSEQSKAYLQKLILEEERRLENLLRTPEVKPEHVANQKKHIEKLRNELAQINPPPQYDLGVPDVFMSVHGQYAQMLLWRNQRIYHFRFTARGDDVALRAKNLLASFQPRALYEVPKAPGFCFPYGFIADEGETAYSIKGSFSFTRTPNVVISLVNAPTNNYRETKPTETTYSDDYRPGYDADKWKKSLLIERTYIGNRLSGFEGWRLDPVSLSREQERAWFGIAHTGGLVAPLTAVQVRTYPKESGGPKEITPPPENVMPSLKKLMRSIKQTLGQ